MIELLLCAMLLHAETQSSGLAAAAERLREGRGEEALALARAVIQSDPGNLDALNNGGFIAESLGRSDEARELFERARRIDPRAVYPLQMLGAIAYDQGRLEESESYYRAALELAPGDEALQRDLDSILERKRTMAQLSEASDRLRGALVATVLGWLAVAGAVAVAMRRLARRKPVTRG
jgi:tetratricopeptide (TPR) repeat protein